MKQKKMQYRIINVLSLLAGIIFSFLLSFTTHENQLQYGLLGFIIGFPILWLMYLSFWFISKGIGRTAFPVQSVFVINGLKKLFNFSVTVYQEKMLVELMGTIIMIAVALGLAGAFFTVASGILFILGRLNW